MKNLNQGKDYIKHLLSYFLVTVLVLVAFLLGAFFSYELKDDKTIVLNSFEESSYNIKFSEEELNYLDNLETVRVCVDPDWKPYEYITESGEFVGIAADLIEIIFNRAGIDFEIVKTANWNESIIASQNGGCDVLAFLNESIDRRAWLDFTDPYFRDPSVFISKTDRPNIHNPEIIAGQVLVLPEGTSTEERLRRDFPDIDIITTASENDVFHMIEQGEADLTVRSLMMAAYTIREGSWFNLKIAGTLDSYDNYFRIGVVKNNDTLVDVLNKSIASLKKEEVDYIVNSYVNINMEEGIDYSMLSYLSLFFIAIIFLFFLRSYYLNHNNKKLISESQNLKMFKLAVDNTYDHVVITDANGYCIYANDAAERMTGYNREEILGQKAGSKENWGGLMSLDVYKKFWKRIKIDKKAFVGELKNIRKNGDYYDVKASVSPVLSDKGDVQFFIGIERDISLEKKIDKNKTEFISLVSHQLKTPLVSISWNLEMLEQGDFGKLNKKQKELVVEMMQTSQRMNSLISSLLNISRLNMGVLDLNISALDWASISDEVVSSMKLNIEAKQHIIVRDYDKILPLINADAKILRIIFENYISNAIKYTDNGSKIRLVLEVKDKQIIFSVINKGYVINEEEKKKIFSKLFRASSAVDNNVEGHGLGLYMVKEIVEAVGGKVGFESSLKKGNRFYASFPIKGMKKNNIKKNK